MSYIEEKTLQLIPVMSFALMFACIEALLGLLLGIFYAIVFGAIFSTIPNSVSGITLNGLGILFSEAATIMPILGFISGLIIGVTIAVIYNFLAPRIRGIKLQFKNEYRPPHSHNTLFSFFSAKKCATIPTKTDKLQPKIATNHKISSRKTI